MHETIQTQSIPEFCKTNGISPSFFYKLQRQGKGPRLMRVGRRTLVTIEAAKEWRAAQENQTQGGN